MNNHPTIAMDLCVDRFTTKQVLAATLHAILFHRLFGQVKPQLFEILGVTMPGVSDLETEQLVREKVDVAYKALERSIGKRLQVSVVFSEKRTKKTWFPGYGVEEDFPWEQWVVNLEQKQPRDKDRQIFDSELSASLMKAVHTILTHTSSERGRAAVPLMTEHKGISPFPYNIIIKQGGVEIL